jgi:tripartite-type tricarboxylate transporter receptor subunit TctC
MKSIRRHVNILDHRQYRGGMMPKVLLAARWAIPGLLIFGCAFVSAQEFPSKAVRIVTYAPGGGTDFASRVIAQGLAINLGWQVIVDNRPGGIIQGEILAKSAPDGYTLLLNGASLWLAPFMQDNVPYDPARDFSAITLAVSAPNILVVHPSLPVKSVRDLIELAKARPGAINYASGSSGTSTHLAGELFKTMAGVNILRIPYKGAGLAINDLIGGHMQLMFPNATSVTPHIKSGRLRAVAVTSARPSALAPGLPTASASGLPGYESGTVYGIFAPARTPPAVISLLNREIVRVLGQAETKEKFLAAGTETVGSSPEEFAATIKSEMSRLGKLIKDAGIRGE